MFRFISDMFYRSSIIEGIGNELLFVMSFAGLCLFLVLAWMSTGVAWELLPVRITLVERSPDVTNSSPVSAPSAQRTPTNVDGVAALSLVEHVELTDTESKSECSSDDDCNQSVAQGTGDLTLEDGIDRDSSTGQTTPQKNGTLEQQELYAARYRSKGHLVIRLQYLDDKSRFVHANPNMSVSRFKRKHFRQELNQQNQKIRLILNGRELIDHGSSPSSTQTEPTAHRRLRLCDYNVRDGSVIHCLISPLSTGSQEGSLDPSHTSGRTTSSSSNYSLLTEFDMGSRLMEPLFAFLLLFTWFFRIVYRQYFNSVSTFALIALSVFFGGAVFAMHFVNATSILSGTVWRRRPRRGNIIARASNRSDTTATDSSDSSREFHVVTMVARRRRLSRQDLSTGLDSAEDTEASADREATTSNSVQQST